MRLLPDLEANAPWPFKGRGVSSFQAKLAFGPPPGEELPRLSPEERRLSLELLHSLERALSQREGDP
ncbi:MAG: hypothetical protein LBE27_01985 [Deltaproteobacteria bacterium]|nr:hypothetical protein [Deltaproteobacteria bacterium]